MVLLVMVKNKGENKMKETFYICKDNGVGKKVNIEGSSLAKVLAEQFDMTDKFLVDCEGCEDFHSVEDTKRVTNGN